MQQQQENKPNILKPKKPFVLQFSAGDNNHRIHSINRLNYEEDIKKDGTFVAKKDLIEHQLFDHHVVQANMKLQGQLKKLHATFIYEKVPDFYAYFFMNQLIEASEQKIQDNIFHETEQLKAKRSYFHVIANSIKAREGCLKQLQKCVDNLFNNQDDNITKHVFKEEMVHYRKLTKFVIGHIRSWKEYLKSISPEITYITYYYRGDDYLIKILEDCEFIFNSFLARQLKFHYKNDPYIMRPFVDSSKQAKHYDLFEFKEEQKGQFMVDLNFLAEQRAKYLESKMHSKADKIKEIQKIYNHKENPLASRISIKKINLLNKRSHSEDKPGDLKGHDSVIKINNFMSDEKKMKFEELNKKTDKMKKIKEMYKKRVYSQDKLANTQNVFANQDPTQTHPYEKKLRYTHFNPTKEPFQPQNTDTDFENLVRKKEMKILENYAPGKTHKKLSNTFKIRDTISQSRAKFLANEEGADQLQKILSQLEKQSPQKLDNYKLGMSTHRQTTKSSGIKIDNESKGLKTSRYVPPLKTSLEHNQEVFVQIRNQVISEIQKGKEESELLEKRKREENQRIHEILEKKINEESVRVIKNSRVQDVEGRLDLANELQSSELFSYAQQKPNKSEKLSAIQEQLKKQMQLKWLRDVQSQLKHRVALQQMQQQKRKDQEKMNKELEKVRKKQQQQKRFEEIERQERALAQKKIIELDENRKKQIEEQMKTIINRQKEKMEKMAMIQKMEIEEELREAMKQKILQGLKQQREKFYDDNKKQTEMQVVQNKYREEVRSKIEDQYQIGLAMKKNRDRQQKMAKIRLVKQKLEDYDHHEKKKSQVSAINQAANTGKQSQVSRDKKLEASQLPDFTLSFPQSPQKEKKKLREQFELELFSFRTPEVYSRIEMQKEGRENMKDNPKAEEEIKLLKKDFRTRIDEKVNRQEFIEEQQQQEAALQEKQKQSQQNIQIDNISKKSSDKTEKQRKASLTSSQGFTRFSQTDKDKANKNNEDLIRIKLGMTQQQYKIYVKKKDAISSKRDFQEENNKKRIEQKKKEIPQKIEEFEKMSVASKHEQQPAEKFSEDEAFPSENDVIELSRTRSKPQTKKVTQNQPPQQEPLRKSQKNKQRREDDIEIMTANSRVDQFYKKHFMTDESDDEGTSPKKHRKKPKKGIKKSQSPQKVKESSEEKDEKKELQPIIKQDKKTLVKTREIPYDKLRQFLDDHFEHMPKTIKRINIYKKQDLYKALLEENSFTILEYIKENLSVGLAIVVHNKNKTKYRSLNVMHLGIYQEDQHDYLDCFVNITKTIMKKDPCEEVSLSVIYDTELSDQLNFIKKLEKVFDPYGAIFQKKIFNTQFQRKMIMRRPIGEEYTGKLDLLNLGVHQLQLDFFITEKKLSDYDGYEPLGFRVGCYGLAAHYLSEKSQQQKLGELIKKSTLSKDPADKHLGYLAKLSLALKINNSFKRLEEIVESQFSDIMALNLQLINKSKKVVSYPPENIEQPNESLWMNFKQEISFPYRFYNQTIKITLGDEQYRCKYLRLTPPISVNNESKATKNRMYTIKSSAYSTNVHILPCKNNTKYKVFVLDSEQYDQLHNPAPLDVYMRVLFANLQKHELSQYENVWIPEVRSSGKFQMGEFDAIIQKSAVIRTNWDFSFLDYLGNSLKVEATHRDLVITPPFIFGVINMQIEKVVDGSPIYIQRVNKDDIRYLQLIEKQVKESD